MGLRASVYFLSFSDETQLAKVICSMSLSLSISHPSYSPQTRAQGLGMTTDSRTGLDPNP